MPNLSQQQLYQYATNAGFVGAARDIIVAIARAESGGSTTAVNPNDPYGGSYGVLQINGAHFQSGTTTRLCALDPQCAFNFAFGLSKSGTDFSPWGTYTNGQYRQYLNTPSLGGSNLSSTSFTSSNTSSSSNSSSCAPWDIPCAVQEGIAGLVHSDFFTQSIIVMVAVVLGLIGVIVLAFGHGAQTVKKDV